MCVGPPTLSASLLPSRAGPCWPSCFLLLQKLYLAVALWNLHNLQRKLMAKHMCRNMQGGSGGGEGKEVQLEGLCEL